MAGWLILDWNTKIQRPLQAAFYEWQVSNGQNMQCLLRSLELVLCTSFSLWWNVVEIRSILRAIFLVFGRLLLCFTNVSWLNTIGKPVMSLWNDAALVRFLQFWDEQQSWVCGLQIPSANTKQSILTLTLVCLIWWLRSGEIRQFKTLPINLFHKPEPW